MIDISDIKVGDRVRVSNDNGDEATFTVTKVYRIWIQSESNLFEVESWDHIEKLTPPLPTKPGVYLPHVYGGGHTPNVWLLNPGGQWIELPNIADSRTRALSSEQVQRHAHTLVYLGTGATE